MPLFLRNDRRIAFIHIPKTGGTSIEQYFESNGWTMRYWSPPRDDGYSPSDQHLLYSDLKTLIPELDDIPSFAVVRHPVKRFISEWQWQRWEMRQFDMGLSQFIGLVEESLAKNRVYWDNHWRPQTDFLSPAVDTVIKLEEIDEMFPRLLKSLAIDSSPELPHTNTRRRGWRTWIRLQHRPQLRKDEIRRIAAMYEADFDALGYQLGGH